MGGWQHCVPGGVPSPRLVGDPVDTLTGAVLDGKLEFRLTGPLELWWWRHYDSSLSHRSFALGWGHTHSFDRRLVFDADGIRYRGPLGRDVGFPPVTQDGALEASQGYRLRRVTPARYQLLSATEPAMEFEFRSAVQPARLSRIFRDAHEIVFHYDEAQRLESIVDSVGRLLVVQEDAHGRLYGVWRELVRGAPLEPLLLYRYDERGNLVASTHATGSGYGFAYDKANRMIRRTGRNGFNFHFEYDERGRCVRASGDDRLYEVGLEYTLPGRLTEVVRADGGTWRYFFDEAGALTQVHDPLGGVEAYVRNADGRVTERLDPAGNATRIAYDDTGAAVAEVDAIGYRHPLPLDPNEPDPLGHRVARNAAEYEYGRLLDVRTLLLPTAGEASALELPTAVRPLLQLRPSGAGAGNGTAEVRPLGVRWWPDPMRGWIFNDLGKLVNQVDDLGRRREWRYDASGNVAEYRDFDGSHWSYDHGRWHFLEGITNPLGAQVRLSYTSGGQVATCRDAGGSESRYGYDLKDRLIEVHRNRRLRETYERDPAGNLLRKRTGSGGDLLSIEFGPANLPVKRTLASGEEHEFEYDDLGRRLMAATTCDVVAFAYDEFGHTVSEKRNDLGVEHTFRGMTTVPAESLYFGRFLVQREHGRNGTLTITDPLGQSHTMRLLPHGVVERRFANGSREIAQYDGLGRCVLKVASRTRAREWVRRYDWSGEGELLRVEDSLHGEIRHAYDAAHRLRGRTLPDGRSEGYGLDAADNLLRQPGLEATVQPGNRLHIVNGRPVEYNERDHLSVRGTPDGPVVYGYDSRDQLTHARTPYGEWLAQYDALGRRTRKRWDGRTTEFHWDGDQLIAETDDEGRLRLYLYADPLALTPVLFIDYESLDAPPRSGRCGYIYSDQIGTPCLVEDEDGRSVWRATVEPYGRTHVEVSEVELNLRFPGHYFDAELELHCNGLRHYDPGLGRYLQSDPWGIAGGYNLYSYRVNPLVASDVRGLGEENDPACNPQRDQETSAPPPAKAGGDYDYLGLPMTRRGKAVDANNPVRIFQGAEREQFRVVAGPNGELIYPNQGNRPVHSPDGSAIYVMDQHGNVYVHENPKYGDVHHSSLAGGEPPVAAGHIAQIGEPPGPQGPHSMNNSSGHYEPDGNRTVLARDELNRQGVDTSGTRLRDVQGGPDNPPPPGPRPAPGTGGAEAEPWDPETGPTSPQTPSARGREGE